MPLTRPLRSRHCLCVLLLLGVGDLLGSIEVGKLANLIVTNGDPLEITTEVRQVFIHGEPVSLENRHQQLYEKYRARP